MNRKPRRTLKRMVDLDRYPNTISIDKILKKGRAFFQPIKQEATDRHQKGKDRYMCAQCGYPVFIACSLNQLPFLKHFKGAPEKCPWYTKNKNEHLHPDDISRMQYRGAQESPLHFHTKHKIAELLNKDPSVTDVFVEKTIFFGKERRRPDVHATYQNKNMVFEIQLSYTPMPTIVKRENFYKAKKMPLIWTICNFNPHGLIKQTYHDVYYYDHRKVIFSIDEKAIKESENEEKFILRAYFKKNDRWVNKFVDLEEILSLILTIKDKWLEEMDSKSVYDVSYAVEELFSELLRKSGVNSIGVERFTEFCRLINCLLSLQEDKIIGTREPNLFAYSNSFLSRDDMKKYGNIFEKIAKKFGHDDVLGKDTVKKKLIKAKQTQQIEMDSPEVKILKIFSREWFD